MRIKVRHGLLLAAVLPLGCHKDNAPSSAASATASPGTLAVAAPAAGGASLTLLDGFEGEVALSAKGKLGSKVQSETPVNFTLQVKDGKIRVDVPAGVADMKEMGKVFLLVAPADKKLFAVLEAKKQTVLVDLDKLAAQAKAMSAARPAPPAHAGSTAELKKTGKTQSVAGYSCEVWHVTQGAAATDLCIAEQNAPWLHVPLEGVPAEYTWASELADGKHFPLQLVTYEGGVEQGRVEVTSIQKKALPAALFVLPPDYAVLDLQQMLAGMMGGMGAMGGAATPGFPPGFSPHGLPPGLAASARAAAMAAAAAHKAH